MRGYENLIGNALAGYPGGYGYPYASPVFGADPSAMPAGPPPGAMAPPGAFGPGLAPPGLPFGAPGAMYGCWGEPACVNPCFDQRRLFSGILGAQCGPLLEQVPMAFEDVGCIDDGEEVDIRAFPQWPAKLVRIILSPSEASSFLITGLFVGITPVGVSQGALPGAMFLPDSDVIMSSVTLFQNQPFTLRAKNVSGAQATLHPGAIVMTVVGGGPQLYGTPLGAI